MMPPKRKEPSPVWLYPHPKVHRHVLTHTYIHTFFSCVAKITI